VQQQYGHRHSLSSGGANKYQEHSRRHQQPVHAREQAQHPPRLRQHPGVQMLQRTASLGQHGYYVTEQNNPGVATMNTNPHPMGSPYPHIPRQGVGRPPLEIPTYSSAPGLTASIQSSPSTFSAASGRSPSTQDGFYTHQPTAQTATYALHSASPLEQPAPQLVAFQPQVPSQAPQQPAPQPQVQAALPAPHEQYQPPQPQPDEPWYSGLSCQPPVEVATIGQMPPYGTVAFDLWGSKIEFEDPSLQLPSARIENL
jgi:hypothetical protein